MPGFDGTGPAGAGPKTGRGMGPCAGYDCPYGNQGRRRWFGFGRRQWVSPTNNLQDLQDESQNIELDINDLKAEREAIKREIEALKKQAKNE